MDELLRSVYAKARNRTDLSVAFTVLVERLKRPRYILQNRATKLNLRIRIVRRWTAEEINLLHAMAGSDSTKAIAKFLNRTKESVRQKMFEQRISAGLTEGFSQVQLAKLFGVTNHKIAGWITRRWLAVEDSRIPQESVEEFVWAHMDEIRFAACEEWWLKMMLRAALRDKRPVAITATRKQIARAA